MAKPSNRLTIWLFSLAILVVAFNQVNQYAYLHYFPQVSRYLALSPSLVIFAVYVWYVWKLRKAWKTRTSHLHSVNREDSKKA